MQYYNRYQQFLINGEQTIVPNVTVPFKTTDKRYIYFGWLIQMANPQYGSMETNIEDGAVLIIPFPLVASLQDYKNAIDNHFFYYGR